MKLIQSEISYSINIRFETTKIGKLMPIFPDRITFLFYKKALVRVSEDQICERFDNQ